MIKLKAKAIVWTDLVLQAFGQAARPGLRECAALVEGEAKRSMKGGRMRVEYKFKKKKDGSARSRLVSTPSPPGTPPNVQSGNLRSMISSNVTMKKVNWVGIAGPTREAPYGAIHEDGGEFGGRTYPARPFMMPALRKKSQSFPGIIARAMKFGVKSTPAANALKTKRLPK